MAYKSMMSDLIRQAVQKSGVDKATGGHASIDEREEEEERSGGSRGKPSKVKVSPRTKQQSSRSEAQTRHGQKETARRTDAAKRVPAKLPGKGPKGPPPGKK